MYLAVADHIGGLTRGRQGYGHEEAYYNSKYNTAKDGGFGSFKRKLIL
jgi:hypothetical protein